MNETLITYIKLGQTDITKLIELIDIYAQVFETKNFSLPNVEYLQTLLDKENVLFFVALLNDSVIGGLTAYILPSVYYPSNQIYIYDLAVKHDWQRKGFGKEIISLLKSYCIEHGYKEIYVQVDFEDQHAIDFYEATGGHSQKVIHFSYELSTVK